jgi:crotonobetainyl-CoA:carnitine CoA-transferase CaiB-like acyl-CoA transferase
MADRKKHEGPLNIYRVLDLADGKGLYGTRLLGELGADVIKIEPPHGAPERNIPPFVGDIPHPERSLYWLYRNTSKRGITLNLDSSLGRDLFKKLVKTADILFETFPPGHMESLGLSYRALSEINPGLIMVSITDFGQSGPHAHYKGSDIVNLALSGATMPCGLPDRPPCTAPGSLANDIAAIFGAVGAMLALFDRGATGQGQYVDISAQEAAIDGMVPWMIPGYSLCVANGTIAGFRMRWRMGPLLTIPCKDGYFTFNVMTEKHRKGFLELMGRPPALVEWVKNTPVSEMLVRMMEFIELCTPYFKEYTQQELFIRGQELGVPTCPIYYLNQFVEDRHIKARGFFTEVKHPEVGSALYPGVPFKMTETPPAVRRPAPTLGQHNIEIWCNEMGLSRDELVALRGAGVI